mgnify:CR=1 FL=1
MGSRWAERAALSWVLVPAASLIESPVEPVTHIASLSRDSFLLDKEGGNLSFEVSLAEGLRYERRSVQSLFATADQKEGMAAFIEKRKLVFRNR